MSEAKADDHAGSTSDDAAIAGVMEPLHKHTRAISTNPAASHFRPLSGNRI